MKLFLLVAVVLAPLFVNAQSLSNGRVNAMIRDLKAGAITRVEVLRIPDDVSSIIAVTQESLRKSPSYSISLNRGFEPALESVLAGVSTQKFDRPSDLRWGLLFFDASGREVGSLFIDHFGMTGYVDGEPARFSDNLSKRIRKFVQELR